jgi:hypothetical protein
MLRRFRWFVHIRCYELNRDVADKIAVDICITTEWRELEGVCMIAELLAKRECYVFMDMRWRGC